MQNLEFIQNTTFVQYAEVWVACDKKAEFFCQKQIQSHWYFDMFSCCIQSEGLIWSDPRRCHGRLCLDLNIGNSLEKRRYPEHWGTTPPALRSGFLCCAFCRVVLKTSRTMYVHTQKKREHQLCPLIMPVLKQEPLRLIVWEKVFLPS